MVNKPKPAAFEAEFKALCKAFLHLKTEEEAAAFLKDLCTPAEISAFVDRWRVAQDLDAGKESYRTIQENTGVSVTTVTRVARFLDNGCNGYRTVLERMKKVR
jgi:TrpR-related protein YerC/YecD